jgi:hypothetical protein
VYCKRGEWERRVEEEEIDGKLDGAVKEKEKRL